MILEHFINILNSEPTVAWGISVKANWIAGPEVYPENPYDGHIQKSARSKRQKSLG
jgi:hypothetical protein